MDKNYGYKYTKGFLTFIVFTIILLLIGPAFAQSGTIDITGNLINNSQTATTSVSTWQNAKFVNELTCWQAGDPNCSAGQPYIRPDGSINFSYGFTELYQVVNVSKALPNSGTGLVTTGFTFSWRSKVGNSWDDEGLDQLKAYVQGYTKSGKWIENYNFDLTFIHNWTDFTWSQNWSQLRRPTDLANVLFGFAGKDNNYWVGPYGPEITNVNFQLKYKPDPCVTNPLYNSDCPKFQETLQKLTEITVSQDTTKPPDSQYNPYTVYQDQTKSKLNTRESLFEKEFGVDEQRLEDGQPIVVDIDRLIDKLIKIDDSQQREQRITMDAATSAISETEKISQQTVRQSEQIAAKSVKSSIEVANLAQQAAVEVSSKQTKSQQSLALFQSASTTNQSFFQLQGSVQQFSVLQTPNQQTSNIAVSTVQNVGIKQEAATNNNLLSLQSGTQQNTVVVPTIGSLISQQQIIQTSQNPTQISLLNPLLGQTSDIPSIQTNFLSNKTDPLNTVLDTKPTIENQNQDSKIDSVKQDVQDSEIAGNLSISSIAKTPVGFNTYLLALADASFYQPKEIYRSQRTVDNRRVLQNLRSDQLHEQMINQQWR